MSDTSKPEGNFGLFKSRQLIDLLQSREYGRVDAVYVATGVKYTLWFGWDKGIPLIYTEVRDSSSLVYDLNNFLTRFGTSRVPWQVDYSQFKDVEEGDFNAPEIEGYVVFTVRAGIVDDSVLKMYGCDDSAAKAAVAIIESFWGRDRYANPDHPRYDGTLKDAVENDYARRKTAAYNLQTVDLSEDTDLVIRPVTLCEDD